MDCGVQVEVSKVVVVVMGGGVVVVRQLHALEMRCKEEREGFSFSGVALQGKVGLTEGPQVAMPLGAVLVLLRVISWGVGV